MASITRVPPDRQDCRHSRSAFHCSFTSIAARRDLSDAAKLLHAALVSMIRRRLDWTQAELARELGWQSRQKVWRAACELVAAGLLKVRRLGLGRPNEYLLVPTDDIGPEDITARAPRVPSARPGHQDDRPRNARARVPSSPKNEGERRERNYLEGRYGPLRART